MRKLTILVDLDDTLEYLTKGWAGYLNDKHGLNVNWRDIKQWDVTETFPMLTRQQVYDPLYDDAFWDYVEPQPYAQEYLLRLIQDGHRVFIVTSSEYETLSAKMSRVLFKYFPYLTWDQVIVAHCKQMINGDILIDDAPHNHEGGVYEKILITAPHNESYNAEANGMLRVNNWHEVYQAVCDIANLIKEDNPYEKRT